MESQQQKMLHSYEEAGKLLNYSRSSLRRHVARQHIRTVRLGNRILIPDAEIRRISVEGLPPLTANVTESTDDGQNENSVIKSGLLK